MVSTESGKHRTVSYVKPPPPSSAVSARVWVMGITATMLILLGAALLLRGDPEGQPAGGKPASAPP